MAYRQTYYNLYILWNIPPHWDPDPEGEGKAEGLIIMLYLIMYFAI